MHRLAGLALTAATVVWVSPVRGVPNVQAEGLDSIFTVSSHPGESLVVKSDLNRLRRYTGGEKPRVAGFPLSRDVSVDLELQRLRVAAPNARFVLGRRNGPDVAIEYNPDRVVMFRGKVSGEADSSVFVAFGPDFATGRIKTSANGGTYQISNSLLGGAKLPSGSFTVYEPTGSGVGQPPVTFCGTDTSGVVMQEGPLIVGDSVPSKLKHIEIAIDSDYEYFELFGNLESALDYTLALYGVMSDIYIRDVNARLELVFIRLWDNADDLFNEPDPFSPFRSQWSANMDNVDRDVAQLLTGRRNLPYGGVAQLNGLCTNRAYSVAGYLLGSFPSPDRPSHAHWDIIVTAHELGHNCNTTHTHSYFPQIDNCAGGEITRSSIMSYCHLNPGGNGNVDLRFHARVQTVMQSYINGAACVDVDCNQNSILDTLDILNLSSADENDNNIPDECEDCNDNGLIDIEEILAAGILDVDFNGVPDSCQADCNSNGRPDATDVMLGFSPDVEGNLVPDECAPDCDGNGVGDYFEILDDMSRDIDRNAVLDTCQDCDGDGLNDFDTLNGRGNIWIAGFFRIAEFHGASGVLVRSSASGQLNFSSRMLIDGTGRVLVGDSIGGQGRIAAFDRDGQPLSDLVPTSTSDLGLPGGIIFGPGGHILIVDSSTNRVLEFDSETGAFRRVVVASGAGGLFTARDLAISPAGEILVTNQLSSRIRRYDFESGAYLGEFFAPGTRQPLRIDGGMVFKPDGNLLVASNGDRAILEYHGQSGEFLRVFTRSGGGGGFWELNNPNAIRIGPDGNVYVLDSGGNLLLQKYDVRTGFFLRSYFILPQGNVFSPNGFDFMPDEIDIDCNLNFLQDDCDIASGLSRDINNNSRPDECETLGDNDNDGDIDLDDYVAFRNCVGGPGQSVSPECTEADIDNDNDVDLIDFGLFATTFTGSCSIDFVIQPDDATVCFGDSATMSVEVNTANASIQWFHDGQLVAGANGPTLLVEPVTALAMGRYSATASTSCRSVQSSTAELLLFTPPTITTQPLNETTCLGGSASFTAAAAGHGPFQYQWRLDGADIPGATAPTLMIANVLAGNIGFYSCRTTDACGLSTTSNAAELVSEEAAFYLQPTDESLCLGELLFLVASANGSDAYQWFKDGEPIAGATSFFIVTENVTEEAAGVYWVVASNECNDTVSETAEVEIVTCPGSP